MTHKQERDAAKENHDTAVRDFLRLFDNEPLRAVQAIRQYLQTPKPLTKKPTYTPSGRVLISATDISKRYRVGKQTVDALQGVTLDIHEGEFVAITGASGSGKSTLLQLLGGLDKPSGGTIRVGDVELGTLSDSRLSRFRGQTIGFVFQFFYLQPFLKLRVNLEVPGMFAGVRRAQRRIRAEEIAQQVGLSDRLDHYPRELSGGQMQRAAIARALLNRPQVLLADEPTGNLDSKNSRAIIELFETIRTELGMTIIIVTHDPEIAARADREIIIKDGALA